MAINFNKFKREEGEELIKPTHMKRKSVQSMSVANKDPKVITAKDIIHSLMLRYPNHKYQLGNVYLFEGWESDFITFSESGLLYEIEIKVAKSDFYDDQKLKIEKHALLENSSPETHRRKPNKFFYAVPKGLLPSHVIPDYAGFIEVHDRDTPAIIVKDAPLMHHEQLLDNEMKESLLKKISFRYRELFLNTNFSKINLED